MFGVGFSISSFLIGILIGAIIIGIIWLSVEWKKTIKPWFCKKLKIGCSAQY